MSSVSSKKSPQTDTVNRYANAETVETTSVEKSVLQDNEVSLGAVFADADKNSLQPDEEPKNKKMHLSQQNNDKKLGEKAANSKDLTSKIQASNLSTPGNTDKIETVSGESNDTPVDLFNTPKMARTTKSSTRKSATRKRKYDRNSLDDVKKCINFDEESQENADEINKDEQAEATKTPEKHQVVPPFKQPSGRKRKLERRSLVGVDDVIKNMKHDDDKK